MLQSGRLGQNIHFCNLDGIFIFLDVASDKYFYLTDRQSEWFRELLEPVLHGTPSRGARNLLEHICRDSKCSPETLHGSLLVPSELPNAHGSILDRDTNRGFAVSTLLKFVESLYRCHLLWRRHELEEIRNTTLRWKARVRISHPPPPIDRVARLTEEFHAITPFFVSTHDACLFRSLLLFRYLTAFNVCPDLVIGVRTSPFSAHCWIQYDGLLLNESYDRASEFKPIMVL